jgi:hypothetical protein
MVAVKYSLRVSVYLLNLLVHCMHSWSTLQLNGPADTLIARAAFFMIPHSNNTAVTSTSASLQQVGPASFRYLQTAMHVMYTSAVTTRSVHLKYH